MPATLSTASRSKMLELGSEVYSAYLLLDMVSSNYYVSKGKDFDVDGQKISLQDHITTLIKERKTEAHFVLGHKPCKIRLTALSNSEWDVSISSSAATNPTELKPIHQYEPDDLINFCNKYPLKVSQEKTGEYKFSAELTVGEKSLRLGGIGKLGLYQLHISNLYTILTRLQDENTNLDMLVAMATGSGKSFTQALWFLIQYLADNPCLFAVPNESLVAQLKRDFERLLPTDLVQNIPAIMDNDPAITEKGSKWAIMSHQKLLKDHWNFLRDQKNKPSNMLLCLDEEHLPAEEELYSKRIKILAEQYPTMFLSATPSEEAYQISGDQPVASLSRKEKEELGVSQPAISLQARTQGTISKSRKKVPLSLMGSLKMAFVSSIEEERLSTAHEYVDQSEMAITYRKESDPFYVAPESAQVRRLMRWNMQAPVGEKSLILVGRHDPIINLSLLRNGQKGNPYKNGNRVLRDGVYNFFQLGRNLDTQCIDNHNQAKLEWRRQLFVKPLQQHFGNINVEEIVEDHIDFADTSQYMEYRVFHGLIENTLTYLLGYDSNQLDHLRFHQFDKLSAEVNAKIATLPRKADGRLDKEVVSQAITTSLLQDQLPLSIAKEIAAAMAEIISKLMIENAENRDIIIDNWQLDKKLHNLFRLGEQSFDRFWDPNESALTRFIEKHKTIFMMKGLEKTATPIEANRPFFDLTESNYRMDDEIVKQNDALRHQLSPLEALDDVNTRQAVYAPAYCPEDYSPAVVDTLFRKGLVGSYITSEKVTGFNDPNLHHVGMIVDDVEDPMNAPDQIIQGSGRNRGLNPAHQPFFFLTHPSDTQIGFSPEMLDKRNYYPDFFEAKKIHYSKLIKHLGTKIATQIKHYIEVEIQPDGSINTVELEKKLHDIIMAEFEQVYKNNKFDFYATRSIFSSVLADVYKSLYVQSEQMKRAYHLPLSARVIAAVLNGLATFYYKLAISWSYFTFFLASRELGKQAKENSNLLPAATYTHIVRNFNYKQLVSFGIPAKRYRDVFKADAEKSVQFALGKNAVEFLKPEIAQELTELFKNEISSYFIRFVGTSKQQEQLLQIISAKKNWLEKLFPHLKELSAFDEQAVEKYFSIIQSDQEIASFMSAHHLIVEMDRPQKTRSHFSKLRTEVERALAALPTTPEDRVKERVSAIVIQNIDMINFLFLPKDAIFLSHHKAAIDIDLSELQVFAANEDKFGPNELPQALLTLLRASLPTEVLEAADQEGCLQLEHYAVADKLEAMKTKMNSTKNLFDMNALRDSLAQNLERYIKSPMLKKIMKTLIGPFSSEQLSTLLDAIYPNEIKPSDANPNHNKEKLRKLMEFKQDLSNLNAKEILKKYASFEDPSDFEKTDIGNIFSWLYDLYEEILACECHWHVMDEKGEHFGHRSPPKLRDTSTPHEIWSKSGTTSNWTITQIAKKTQFLKATQNSFAGLNQVEATRSQLVVNTMQETARFFMQPLKKALNYSHPNVNRDASNHQHTLFKAAQNLGDRMRTADSLTTEDVASSKTKHLNAVQKLRG